MNQMPKLPDSQCLNDFQRQNLEAKLKLLHRALERFPDLAGEHMQRSANLAEAESWAKSTTIHLFSLFRALVAIKFRTGPMDQAIEHTRQSFHAVFELVFCSIREPKNEDFQRAKLAVENVVSSCGRLI